MSDVTRLLRSLPAKPTFPAAVIDAVNRVQDLGAKSCFQGDEVVVTELPRESWRLVREAGFRPEIRHRGEALRWVFRRGWDVVDTWPKPGMGATVNLWSDRHAVTITRVSPTGYRVWYRRDQATRTDDNGMSECQRYTYAPDPTAPEECAVLHRDGEWYPTGARRHLSIGLRAEYYDYSH